MILQNKAGPESSRNGDGVKPAPVDAPAVSSQDLRKKYQEEKEKRLRSDGLAQYRDNDEESLQHLYKDPFARTSNSSATRPSEPVSKSTRVVIVGGGWAGILLAVKLIKSGIDDFVIVDKASQFGGTWYWNQYPGVMCDVESLIYMPLLEETGHMPTEYYTHGPELLAHAERVAQHFKLHERALLQTEVASMDWDDDRDLWVVKTKQGDVIESHFVNIPGGHLHRAKFPGAKGIESFKGKSFHSSRWDYEYTGGDMTGNLHKLADKKVAIIGTGATAIQIIPQLAKYSKHLYVFQRTPSAVDIRGNREMEAEWYKTLEPGWQRKRIENFHEWVTGRPTDADGADQVSDGWTWIARNYSIKGMTDMPEILARMLEGNDAKMNAVRARIDEVVKDPVTANKLKPWYRWMCKRPCFHEDYLPSFNQPNVTLIDTNGKGVDEVTPTGIRFDDETYDVDCIVYATGFYLPANWASPSNIQIRGRNGLHLGDKRKALGVRTLHSVTTHDFPNALFTQFTQTSNPANATHFLTEIAEHQAYLVATAKQRGLRTIEPSKEAEEAYSQEIFDTVKKQMPLGADCTPGYYNNEGKGSPQDLYSGLVLGVGNGWYRRLRTWREDGQLEGMQTTVEGTSVTAQS